MDITETSGPLFVSYSIQCVLYGAVCIQVYLYYLSFPNDTALMKSLVSLLSIVVTAQFSLKTHDIFIIYVQNFTSPEVLDRGLLAWLSVPIADGLVGGVVQLFFSYRIWILTKSKLLLVLPASLALASSIAAIVNGGLASKTDLYSEVHGETVRTTTVWMAASAACDIFVATVLSYHYYKRKSGPTMRNAPLAFVVSMTMETGTITAFTAIVELFLFFHYPHNGFYTAPAVFMAVLYANSCMAILNSRIVISGGREEPPTKDILISSSGVARHTAAGLVKRFVDVAPTAPPVPTVQIQTEVWGEPIPMSNIKRSSHGLDPHHDFDSQHEESVSSK